MYSLRDSSNGKRLFTNKFSFYGGDLYVTIIPIVLRLTCAVSLRLFKWPAEIKFILMHMKHLPALLLMD